MNLRATASLPLMLAATLALASCATAPRQDSCPAGTQRLPGCPPIGAVDDAEINDIYQNRSWLPPG